MKIPRGLLSDREHGAKKAAYGLRQGRIGPAYHSRYAGFCSIISPAKTAVPNSGIE
jgi:hypothetical protein